MRENSIESLEQLGDYFDRDGAVRYLRSAVQHLQHASLIDWDQDNDRIEISQTSARVLHTLGASLTELANRSDKTLLVEPLFPRPESAENWVDVFVLMPFTPELKPVYEDHLKKVCDNCDLSAARADDFFNTNEVMADIWNAIFQSRIVIADCSGRNPNVFYELGIAHTIGKSVVLVTQSEDDIPFDIRHRRYIQYQGNRMKFRQT